MRIESLRFHCLSPHTAGVRNSAWPFRYGRSRQFIVTTSHPTETAESRRLVTLQAPVPRVLVIWKSSEWDASAGL